MIFKTQHTALLFSLCICLKINAQENTSSSDFNVPKNTEILLEITGMYDTEKNTFTQTLVKEYLFNSNGKLLKLTENSNENSGNQYIYHYDLDGELYKMDYHIGSTHEGIVGSTTFTTEKDHYKTTYLRKELNGETSKRIEFYNEAGQLRGKSVYNAFGEREVQIEFDGKKAYRTKLFKDNKIVSDVIYTTSNNGNVSSRKEYIQPGRKHSLEQLTTIRYNSKGDPVKKIKYYESKAGLKPKVKKTYLLEYWYDDYLWVARMEFENDSKPNTEHSITLRHIKTTNNLYTIKNEKVILDLIKKKNKNVKI
ncbi:hypothetical protein [Imtechella halotolerans]|uniref:Uncharacterized protein n=1 Tax=Imtechella halotolerans K1 TaxID=946077 RepID=I0W6Y1_9FLAO|nr:hypothetical protein [Imtechella halotolerans]EID72147.1 hypothetical protein W5A_11606 [Imtechella halotolerans K1]WMQ64249.1 hypothetical protein PT603_04550 [Imtechella halotolerans]